MFGISKNVSTDTHIQPELPSCAESERIKNSIESWVKEDVYRGELREIASERFKDCMEKNMPVIDLRNLNLRSLPARKPECIKSYLLEGNDIETDNVHRTAFNQSYDTEIFPGEYDDSWATFNLCDWRKCGIPERINIVFEAEEFGMYFTPGVEGLTLVEDETLFKREMEILTTKSAKTFSKDPLPLHDSCIYTENSKGMWERNSFPVLYRCDSRKPEQLENGFFKSNDFSGIKPMRAGDVLITSASLRGAECYGRSDLQTDYNTYAILSDGVNAASWNENFLYNKTLDPARIGGDHFCLGYDEVHADISGITPEKIFILASSDPEIQRRLAFIFNNITANMSSSPLRISIKDYCDNVKSYPDISKLPDIESYIPKIVKRGDEFHYETHPHKNATDNPIIGNQCSNV